MTPAHDWRDRRLAPEVWLLAERDTGATPRTKYFFVNLPATTSWPQLVRLAHQRWAIEQLLLGPVLPVFSLVAPCQPGAAPVFVRRGTFTDK